MYQPGRPAVCWDDPVQALGDRSILATPLTRLGNESQPMNDSGTALDPQCEELLRLYCTL